MAGSDAVLTWLVTPLLAAALYSIWVLWPERAATFGARQLMSEALASAAAGPSAPAPEQELVSAAAR